MDETAVRRGLSAAWLKYFACVFMFIDHLAHIWNPVYTLAGNSQPTPLWANTMFYLGRLAFPIFVFFVAEGCRKTHDIRRYLLRLTVFAAIAQLPFTLLFQKPGGSIVFTFLLGVLGVSCFQRLQGRFPKAVAVLPALGLAVLGQLTGTDYVLVPALYLCGGKRRRQLICLAAGLFASYLI